MLFYINHFYVINKVERTVIVCVDCLYCWCVKQQVLGTLWHITDESFLRQQTGCAYEDYIRFFLSTISITLICMNVMNKASELWRRTLFANCI